MTVTASKIKFYNKGDTIVYNADAFQLAEGSMLDALIAQLPGVELNDQGQIKVNGQFVESLLLNGREDFNDIDARHFSYGINGNFRLPYGFGISTDFTLYTRRGYGVKELDTTDAIWNMRLTYTPRGGRWVFMADGFDMLHQLSNVNYAVNASGRTVTYTNVLPRYVMFSAQYRLNIQPKRK
ncbi:MAG: hypothetical protein NC411_04980 [Bacteroides sp.]|nr:hypothetical protein [Bacteroides sp.]